MQCYCCSINFILLNALSVVPGRKLTPGSNSPAQDWGRARLGSLQPCTTAPMHREMPHQQSTLSLPTGTSCEADSRDWSSPHLHSTLPGDGLIRAAASCKPPKGSPMFSPCSLLLQATTGHSLRQRDHHTFLSPLSVSSAAFRACIYLPSSFSP